jgi:hypothetical protein
MNNAEVLKVDSERMISEELIIMHVCLKMSSVEFTET